MSRKQFNKEYKDFGENAFLGKGTAIYNKLYKQKILVRKNQILKEGIYLLKKYQAFLKQKRNKI